MPFNCYIDESGDEGISTGGTRWFIMGAVIVDSKIDLKTRILHGDEYPWLPKGMRSPAVLVTDYRPDPHRWEEGFLRMRK